MIYCLIPPPGKPINMFCRNRDADLYDALAFNRREGIPIEAVATIEGTADTIRNYLFSRSERRTFNSTSILREYDEDLIGLIKETAAAWEIKPKQRVIELRRMPYKQYLASPEWEVRRKICLRKSGGRCMVCSSEKGISVHHRTYERLGCESDSDLIALCKSCHHLFHQAGKLEATGRRREKRKNGPRFDAETTEELCCRIVDGRDHVLLGKPGVTRGDSVAPLAKKHLQRIYRGTQPGEMDLPYVCSSEEDEMSFTWHFCMASATLRIKGVIGHFRLETFSSDLLRNHGLWIQENLDPNNVDGIRERIWWFSNHIHGLSFREAVS